LLTVCEEEGGRSFTLPCLSKTRDYHHTLSEEDWISWHQQSWFFSHYTVALYNYRFFLFFAANALIHL